jgi:hypothetical protein
VHTCSCVYVMFNVHTSVPIHVSSLMVMIIYMITVYMIIDPVQWTERTTETYDIYDQAQAWSAGRSVGRSVFPRARQKRTVPKPCVRVRGARLPHHYWR